MHTIDDPASWEDLLTSFVPSTVLQDQVWALLDTASKTAFMQTSKALHALARSCFISTLTVQVSPPAALDRCPASKAQSDAHDSAARQSDAHCATSVVPIAATLLAYGLTATYLCFLHTPLQRSWSISSLRLADMAPVCSTLAAVAASGALLAQWTCRRLQPTTSLPISAPSTHAPPPPALPLNSSPQQVLAAWMAWLAASRGASDALRLPWCAGQLSALRRVQVGAPLTPVCAAWVGVLLARVPRRVVLCLECSLDSDPHAGRAAAPAAAADGAPVAACTTVPLLCAVLGSAHDKVAGVEVVLQGRQEDPACYAALSRALRSLPALTSLRVAMPTWWARDGTDHDAHLARALPALPELTCLELQASWCEAATQGAACALASLPRLQTLRLQQVLWSTAAMSAFTQSAGALTALTALTCDLCALPAVSSRDLCAQLAPGLLTLSPRLQALCLRRVDVGAGAMASALAACTSLQRLELRLTPTRPDTGPLLARALAAMPRLTALTLWSLAPPNAPPAAMASSATEAETAAAALRHRATTAALQTDYVAALAEGISGCGCLEELSLGGWPLALPRDAVEALAAALGRGTPRLRHLQLRTRVGCEAGLQRLVLALAACEDLARLSTVGVASWDVGGVAMYPHLVAEDLCATLAAGLPGLRQVRLLTRGTPDADETLLVQALPDRGVGRALPLPCPACRRVCCECFATSHPHMQGAEW